MNGICTRAQQSSCAVPFPLVLAGLAQKDFPVDYAQICLLHLAQDLDCMYHCTSIMVMKQTYPAKSRVLSLLLLETVEFQTQDIKTRRPLKMFYRNGIRNVNPPILLCPHSVWFCMKSREICTFSLHGDCRQLSPPLPCEQKRMYIF